MCKVCVFIYKAIGDVLDRIISWDDDIFKG
jgi:hypothetical protein